MDKAVTPRQEREIAALSATGKYTYAEIGARFGTTASTVHRVLKDPKRGEPRKIALKPCGTVAAYRRHKRKGEYACLPCSQAKATYERERNNP